MIANEPNKPRASLSASLLLTLLGASLPNLATSQANPSSPDPIIHSLAPLKLEPSAGLNPDQKEQVVKAADKALRQLLKSNPYRAHLLRAFVTDHQQILEAYKQDPKNFPRTYFEGKGMLDYQSATLGVMASFEQANIFARQRLAAGQSDGVLSALLSLNPSYGGLLGKLGDDFSAQFSPTFLRFLKERKAAEADQLGAPDIDRIIEAKNSLFKESTPARRNELEGAFSVFVDQREDLGYFNHNPFSSVESLAQAPVVRSEMALAETLALGSRMTAIQESMARIEKQLNNNPQAERRAQLEKEREGLRTEETSILTLADQRRAELLGLADDFIQNVRDGSMMLGDNSNADVATYSRLAPEDRALLLNATGHTELAKMAHDADFDAKAKAHFDNLALRQKIQNFQQLGLAFGALISMKNPRDGARFNAAVNAVSSIALAYTSGGNPAMVMGAAASVYQAFIAFQSKDAGPTDLEIILDSLDQLSKKLDALSDQMRTMHEDMLLGFNGIHDHLNQVQAQLDHLDRVTSKILGEVGDTRLDIQDLHNAFSDVYDRQEIQSSLIQAVADLDFREELNSARIRHRQGVLRQSEDAIEIFLNYALVGSSHPLATGSVLSTLDSRGEVGLFWPLLNSRDLSFARGVPTGFLDRAVVSLYPYASRDIDTLELERYPVGTQEFIGRSELTLIEATTLYLTFIQDWSVNKEQRIKELEALDRAFNDLEGVYRYLSSPDALRASLGYWDRQKVQMLEAIRLALADPRVSERLSLPNVDLSRGLEQFDSPRQKNRAERWTSPGHRREASNVTLNSNSVANVFVTDLPIDSLDPEAEKRTFGLTSKDLQLKADLNTDVLLDFNRFTRRIMGVNALPKDQGSDLQVRTLRELGLEYTLTILAPALTKWDRSRPWNNENGFSLDGTQIAGNATENVLRKEGNKAIAISKQIAFHNDQLKIYTLPTYQFDFKARGQTVLKLDIQSALCTPASNEDKDTREYGAYEVWRRHEINEPTASSTKNYFYSERLNSFVQAPKERIDSNWTRYRKLSAENIMFVLLDYVDSNFQNKTLIELDVQCKDGLISAASLKFSDNTVFTDFNLEALNAAIRVAAKVSGISEDRPAINGIEGIHASFTLTDPGKFFEPYEDLFHQARWNAIPLVKSLTELRGHPLQRAAVLLDQAAELYSAHGVIATVAKTRPMIDPVLAHNGAALDNNAEQDQKDREYLELLKKLEEALQAADEFHAPFSPTVMAMLDQMRRRLSNEDATVDLGSLALSTDILMQLEQDLGLLHRSQLKAIEDWDKLLGSNPALTFVSYEATLLRERIKAKLAELKEK